MASHSSPRVLAKIASMAPRSLACARATTFSAYDVVFSPAVGARSLRTHGTTTTRGVRRWPGVRAGGDDVGEVGVVPVGAERPRPPVTV